MQKKISLSLVFITNSKQIVMMRISYRQKKINFQSSIFVVFVFQKTKYFSLYNLCLTFIHNTAKYPKFTREVQIIR